MCRAKAASSVGTPFMLSDITRFLFVCLFLTMPTLMQSDYAAVLHVVYPGVEVQRVNTAQWFSLPQDAIAILGVGDKVRTDTDGRALITFDDQFTLLVMPESIYELQRFKAEADGAINVDGTIEGHAIHQTLSLNPETIYALSLDVLTVTHPADLFAVWSDFESTPVVISAEGRLELKANDETLEVSEGEGFYLDDQLQVTALDAPYNAARLIGQEYGCPGTVEIINQNRLNLRGGTGTGYIEIGYIENDDTVEVMGINESASWIRVQRFSGFGWVQALAINHDCEDLPVFPNVTGESNRDLFSVSAIELPLLRPFYGEADENVWFYRSLRD